MKNSRDLILGEVFYIAIIYHIPDSWVNLWKDSIFSFDHMTDENRDQFHTRALHNEFVRVLPLIAGKWKLLSLHWHKIKKKLTRTFIGTAFLCLSRGSDSCATFSSMLWFRVIAGPAASPLSSTTRNWANAPFTPLAVTTINLRYSKQSLD